MCLFITVISSTITYAFAWTIVNSAGRRVRADLRLYRVSLDLFLAPVSVESSRFALVNRPTVFLRVSKLSLFLRAATPLSVRLDGRPGVTQKFETTSARESRVI